MGDHQKLSVLRATEEANGAVVFAFLFHEGAASDWELQPLLERALGPQAAEEARENMREMLEREQYGWSFSPVQFD